MSMIDLDDPATVAALRAVALSPEEMAAMLPTQAQLAELASRSGGSGCCEPRSMIVFGVDLDRHIVVTAIGRATGSGTATGVAGPSPAELRRMASRARQRRWRARQDAGLAVYPVAVGGDLLSALVRWGWLSEHDLGDPHKVSQALSEALAEVAGWATLKKLP